MTEPKKDCSTCKSVGMNENRHIVCTRTNEAFNRPETNCPIWQPKPITDKPDESYEIKKSELILEIEDEVSDFANGIQVFYAVLRKLEALALAEGERRKEEQFGKDLMEGKGKCDEAVMRLIESQKKKYIAEGRKQERAEIVKVIDFFIETPDTSNRGIRNQTISPKYSKETISALNELKSAIEKQ